MDHPLMQYLVNRYPHWRIEPPAAHNYWFWIGRKGSTEVSAVSAPDLETTLEAIEALQS